VMPTQLRYSAPTTQTRANRANALHSTGPRTDVGKARAAQNSIRHGLTALDPVLPSEDRAPFDRHTAELLNEYQPQGPTETNLVHELADASWRLGRIHALEANVFQLTAPAGSINVDDPDLATCLAVTEALRQQERSLNTISTYGYRLHRQYHKTLDHLRDIQAARRASEQKALKQAAAFLEMHKHKGIPFDPAANGFVFSKDQIEAHSQHLMRLQQSYHYEYVLFDAPPHNLKRTGPRANDFPTTHHLPPTTHLCYSPAKSPLEV
jgi:hypothetical protein